LPLTQPAWKCPARAQRGSFTDARAQDVAGASYAAGSNGRNVLPGAAREAGGGTRTAGLGRTQVPAATLTPLIVCRTLATTVLNVTTRSTRNRVVDFACNDEPKRFGGHHGLMQPNVMLWTRIVCGIIGVAVANYIATVLMLCFSMEAWSDTHLLFRILRLNISPWAEWTGGSLFIVPILFIVTYMAVRIFRRHWTFVSTSLALSGVVFLYVFVADVLVVARLPHISAETFALHVLLRAVRIAIMATLSILLADALERVFACRSFGAHRSHGGSGFTLVELLVVVGILVILMAIVLAVASGAKRASNVTVDISQMRQVFLALNLYEEESGEFPRSLLDTKKFVTSPQLYRSPVDLFGLLLANSFPADLYVFDSGIRSPFRISYAYLRAFEGRQQWHPRLSWEQFRQDPRVGVLANRMYCPKSARQVRDPIRSEHDYIRLPGMVLRIRMDGSLWRARPNDGTVLGGSINGLFVDP